MTTNVLPPLILIASIATMVAQLIYTILFNFNIISGDRAKTSPGGVSDYHLIVFAVQL